ncbi:MAG: histidine kinase, partial [Myxococcales bacterium]|nr:histidine kinase [Myxococcales bacterium]
ARAGDALVIERAPACARVFTDPLRLKQILLNLLGNAVKFTEEGMITLRVTCADEVTRFEVSDTGIGMDAETLDRVFVEFTQADESSTRRYGGAGLGLALSLRLARLLGARLSAASTPGEGSTFTLELPARPPAA